LRGRGEHYISTWTKELEKGGDGEKKRRRALGLWGPTSKGDLGEKKQNKRGGGRVKRSLLEAFNCGRDRRYNFNFRWIGRVRKRGKGAGWAQDVGEEVEMQNVVRRLGET